MSGRAQGTALEPEVQQAARDMHRLMVRCRVLESTCCRLNPRWFPAEGEEAVIVGTFYGLRPDDAVVPHYRGPFVVYLMRGAELTRLLAQCLGRSGGYGKGRAPAFTGPAGGGVLPWVAGDLGTNLSLGTGAALAFQYEGSDRVAVLSTGDGTTNRGDFHEALNLAAVWRLPAVYVVQHNQYSISMHASQYLACTSIADRALGYGIAGESLDGNDVLAVHEAVQRAVARARAGAGPTLLEARTYRIGGHWAADEARYRPAEEVRSWRERDPIDRLARLLLSKGLATEEELRQDWRAAEFEVQAAEAEASALPPSDAQGLGEAEVFAEGVQLALSRS